jgi:hypothetical protein
MNMERFCISVWFKWLVHIVLAVLFFGLLTILVSSIVTQFEFKLVLRTQIAGG